MLETFWQLTQNLFAYQEFLALFRLFQACLWVLILIIIVFVAMHVLYMLGYQTPLYKKRSPRSHWSKKFFRAAALLAVLILFTLAGLEWLERNVPRASQSQTILKQLTPYIQQN